MKLKKNSKGFTIVEMLVSMTIFAIMSMLMAVVFTAAARLNVKNHKMNEQMHNQGDAIEQKPAADPTKAKSKDITLSINGKSVTINVDEYNAASAGDDANLKYYQPAVTPTP